MSLSKRDMMATGVVAVAFVLYLLWVFGAELPGLHATRATGVVVLACGFLASATAVVPSFADLLHGSRMYLALTSVIGTVAAVAGVFVLFAPSAVWLGVVMAAMIVLWLIATAHHVLLARTTRTSAR